MIIAKAPVRISFAGGGTDLPAYYAAYGGLVISTAIARYCYVIADVPDDDKSCITSADYVCMERFANGALPPINGTLALPKAAVAWFAERGLLMDGVRLFLASQVPPGSGLGSSSAMTLAILHALAAFTRTTFSNAEAAELACQLEIGRLRMPIGKQDQYASAFGGLNRIEFNADGVQVTPLDLPSTTVTALRQRLLLFSTGMTHDSASILRQQQADMTSNSAVIDTLHQIKALAERVQCALLDGDLDGFGQLLDEGWRMKRRLSKNISSTAIDRWYEAAQVAGALGGKITGAGGGGFLLLYCPPESQALLRATMRKQGLSEIRFAFDHAGAHVLSQPAAKALDEPTGRGRLYHEPVNTLASGEPIPNGNARSACHPEQREGSRSRDASLRSA